MDLLISSPTSSPFQCLVPSCLVPLPPPIAQRCNLILSGYTSKVITQLLHCVLELGLRPRASFIAELTTTRPHPQPTSLYFLWGAGPSTELYIENFYPSSRRKSFFCPLAFSVPAEDPSVIWVPVLWESSSLETCIGSFSLAL